MKKSTGLLVAAAAGAILGALAMKMFRKRKSSQDIWKEGTKKFSKEADDILASARKKFDKLAKEYNEEKITSEKVNGV